METNFSRGSEWRKWDLHIHTASSYDAYKGQDADGLLSQAWKQNNLAAVAVTDHFVIDAERIHNLKELVPEITIFPGVELRTDKGTTNLHVIILFPEDSNLKELSENFRVIMLNQKAKASDSNESIYWDFNDIVLFAKTYNGLISLHTGAKTQGLDAEISNTLPINIAIKTEIAEQSHFYEIGKIQDIKTHVDKIFPHIGHKPLLLCSDNHDPRKYVIKENMWVKADPTFEGLKQLVFEPQERVRIQHDKPQEKKGYHIIDSVELNCDGIWQQTIKLNENLNSIIGGRATGKSTLLGSIAAKCGSDINDRHIKNLKNYVSVNWKDKSIDPIREIDYFSQSYMYEIASERVKRDDLATAIIKEHDDLNIYVNYIKSLSEIKDNVSTKVRRIFNINSELSDLRSIQTSIGNIKGIETEIQLINEKIAENKVDITEDILEKYKDFEKRIFQNENLITVANEDILYLKQLKGKSLFNDSINYSFSDLSENSKSELTSEYEKLRSETELKWVNTLDSRISSLSKTIDEKTYIINSLKSDPIFQEGVKATQTNKQYLELNERLNTEMKKLKQAQVAQENFDSKFKERDDCLYDIVKAHLQFKEEAIQLKNSLIIKKGDIEIKAKVFLLKDQLHDFLTSRLNQQGRERQEFVLNLCRNYTKHTDFQTEIFLKKAIFHDLEFKSGNRNEDVTIEFLSSNWFKISFDIRYQNDSFDKMSLGKKAFVILKFLLEFSQKECPILIDQPEDSLDNRAIYNELVKYIISKKKKRQIILVTHNSNVVVSADSEQVIVANQSSDLSPNIDNLKFQYLTGSLENSKTLNDNEPITLSKKGIREHVCEILEGGDEAFKKREQKYCFNK